MIAVYGASGSTGSWVARELVRRGRTPVLVGRDRSRLSKTKSDIARLFGDAADEVSVRVARAHDRNALADAFADTDVVVNCAGPAVTLGKAIVDAAIEAGNNYLDTAGEQSFLRWVYERRDSAARRAGVAVVPGHAFEVAIGDWAAALACRASIDANIADGGSDRSVGDVSVMYALRGFEPTVGTGLSVVAALSGAGCSWRLDRWVPDTLASRSKQANFGGEFGARPTVWFPAGEIITIPRHVQCSSVEAFVAMPTDSPLWTMASRAAGVLSPLLAPLLAAPVAAAARSQLGAHRRKLAGPSSAKFTVLVEVDSGFDRFRTVVRGGDPYELTAAITADGAIRLSDDDCAAGVRTSAELVPADEGLAMLESRGLVEVERP